MDSTALNKENGDTLKTPDELLHRQGNYNFLFTTPDIYVLMGAFDASILVLFEYSN